jgi:hypothetical protein
MYDFVKVFPLKTVKVRNTWFYDDCKILLLCYLISIFR